MNGDDYELRHCPKEGKLTHHKIYHGDGCKVARCVPCSMKLIERAREAFELQEVYGTKLTRNV